MLEHYAGKSQYLLCVIMGCVQGTDLAIELGNLSFAFLSVLIDWVALGNSCTLLYGTSVLYFQRAGRLGL